MCKFAPAFFSFGPSIAQPLAALPLTDAAYPLRVRPVCLRPKCRRYAAVSLRHAPAGAVFSARPNQGPPPRPARWGEEEQGSGRSFRRQAETELSGLCDDDNGGWIAPAIIMAVSPVPVRAHIRPSSWPSQGPPLRVEWLPPPSRLHPPVDGPALFAWGASSQPSSRLNPRPFGRP